MPSFEMLRTGATYSHPSGTTEQTVFTFTPTGISKVTGIWLDLVNLTQNSTIRVRYTIDGTNFRTFQTIVWTTGMDDGVLINGNLPVNTSYSLRVTIQSAVAEGASRDIVYEFFREHLGSGAIAFTYTVTNSVTSAPLDNVSVWVSSDSSGNNVIAEGTTNASGQVVFRLDAGTYFFWRELAGYTFSPEPDSEVVS